ncbi:MAG: hypothetical protein WBA73_15165 [Devosia sp.]
MAWVYVGVVVAGLLSSYTTVVGLRSGLTGNRLLIAVAGGIAGLFLLSLLIWGFVALEWYWPIIAFAAGAVISAVAINTTNFAFWYTASPFLYTATAIGGIYLWSWPF